jgi:hypothetical protein
MLFYLYGNLELSGEGGHYNLQSDVKKSIADIHREKSIADIHREKSNT